MQLEYGAECKLYLSLHTNVRSRIRDSGRQLLVLLIQKTCAEFHPNGKSAGPTNCIRVLTGVNAALQQSTNPTKILIDDILKFVNLKSNIHMVDCCGAS
jgi:hypothetical protein